jgi:hypothetical protein
MSTKTRILIPFILTALALIYCWLMLSMNRYIPSWKHYAALLGFLLIALAAWKKLKNILIPLGGYLLLASFHIISLSYKQSVFGLGKDTTYNPSFQLMSLGLFVLYAVLNIDVIIEWNLDRKERNMERQNTPKGV